MVRTLFWDAPSSLSGPSAWRLIFDEVNIKNGTTVLVVIVSFTDHKGQIRSCPIGIDIPNSKTGEATASALHTLLNEVLHIDIRQVVCKVSAGLPIRAGGPTSSHLRQQYLTSMWCEVWSWVGDQGLVNF